MGPILICDKSTLQGLGRVELNLLRKYYFLNVPPVLLAEILGDLKKHANPNLSRNEVRDLANKLVPACCSVNVGFRDLISGELAGHPITMDGRPVKGGGKRVMSNDGKMGVVFEHTPESEALLRWQSGKFLEAEALLADVWRLSTQFLDLESMQRQLRPAYSGQVNLRTLTQTCEFVDGLIVSAPPDLLLSWLLRDAGLSPMLGQDFVQRIRGLGNGSLKLHAPYTAHCLRVSLTFHFALAFGLIGTRPTNRIDMEYLYYTPFCQAFSSGDAFHRKTAPLFMHTDDQMFVLREELKADLRRLAEWWAGMGEPERERERDRQGPPENAESVTHRLWSRAMKPGYRDQRPLSSETQKKLFEAVRERAKNNTPTKSQAGSLDDCDFVLIKHHVRAGGPCICGSERLFKDCCGREIGGAIGKT